MSERENAIIDSTMLGTEDHGIFTCWLSLTFDDTGQGFGGYGLDEPIHEDGKFKGRIGSAYGMDFIMGILKALSVESWEKLKGTHCRVERADRFGKITKIGHILKDQWFDPEALAEKHNIRKAARNA
jgi:hypothetical protein